CSKPLHLFRERFAVVFLRLGTDVAPRREYVPVFTDVFERCAFAETRDVFVGRSPFDMLRTNGFFSAPQVIHASDARDLLICQFAVSAVYHAAQLADVDEEHVAATIAELTVLLVAREEPEASWNLRRIEKLSRQRHHTIYEVGLDEVLADSTFA